MIRLKVKCIVRLSCYQYAMVLLHIRYAGRRLSVTCGSRTWLELRNEEILEPTAGVCHLVVLLEVRVCATDSGTSDRNNRTQCGRSNLAVRGVHAGVAKYMMSLQWQLMRFLQRGSMLIPPAFPMQAVFRIGPLKLWRLRQILWCLRAGSRRG